jgi:hypothetical protein
MIDRDTVISIHEAGHAVVARALALRCGGAMVADGCGRADYHDDEAGDGLIAVIIAHMAGAAAESVLTGRLADGLRGDQAQIVSACAVRDMTQHECDQLWRSVLALVRANEVAMRSVADALLERGELSGAQIDALLTGGSM